MTVTDTHAGSYTAAPPDRLAQFVDQCLTPFPPEVVGKLPRVTCSDCQKRSCQQHHKARCRVCQNNISTEHIHLDYVGHAELTARLLHLDPMWVWEPMAYNDQGLPAINVRNGTAELWIHLTVNGIRRPGVGTCSASKEDASKELIGDALRNAAMRFGLALDLWAKGELNGGFGLGLDAGTAVETPAPPPPPPAAPAGGEWWDAAGWPSAEAHGRRRQALLRRLQELPPEHLRTAKRWLAEQATYAVFDADGGHLRSVGVWVPAQAGKPDGPGMLAAGLSREAMDAADAYIEEMSATAALEAGGGEPFDVPPPVAEAMAFAEAHGGTVDQPTGPTVEQLLKVGTAKGIANATKGTTARLAQILAHANTYLAPTAKYQSVKDLAADTSAAVRYHQHLAGLDDLAGIQ